MNHDVSTGQKYLLKIYLLQGSIVQLFFIFHFSNSLISFHLILITILEKYLSRNSFFRLKTCSFQKVNPFAGIPVLFLLYKNTCKMQVFPIFEVSSYNNFRILRILDSLEPLPKAVSETFYLRNFMFLISFLFYLYKASIFVKLSLLPKSVIMIRRWMC